MPDERHVGAKLDKYEAEIEGLRAENESLLLYAQMACSKCRQNVHLKKLELQALTPDKRREE